MQGSGSSCSGQGILQVEDSLGVHLHVCATTEVLVARVVKSLTQSLDAGHNELVGIIVDGGSRLTQRS